MLPEEQRRPGIDNYDAEYKSRKAAVLFPAGHTLTVGHASKRTSSESNDERPLQAL